MKRILLPLFVIAATGVAHADDDIRDKFNPVHTAVISQTIASDARAAALGDVGTPQNTPSPSRVPVFRSTTLLGFAS